MHLLQALLLIIYDLVGLQPRVRCTQGLTFLLSIEVAKTLLYEAIYSEQTVFDVIAQVKGFDLDTIISKHVLFLSFIAMFIGSLYQLLLELIIDI